MIDPVRKQTEHLSQGSESPAARVDTHIDDEAEYVDLPSKGFFYRDQYKGMDKLKVRKLNWEDEDILTTKSYYDNGTLFNELLKNVIVDDNGFKASNLVAIDRDTILIWLRIAAFGPEYIIPWTCRNEDCGKKIRAMWNLGEIEVSDFDSKYLTELQETGSVTVELPVSKRIVRLTVPSIGRELEIQKHLKHKKEKFKSDKDYIITGRLLSVISEVILEDGVTLKQSDEVLKWMRDTKLPIVDSRHVQKIAKEIDLRVESKQDITCKHCDHSEEGVEMAMSIHFLWPEYQGVPGLYVEGS